jgi:sugar phosphate isomerase/epimerase
VGGESMNQEIVLSHFSLARHCPIDVRIAAASAAGFSNIGLYVGDYQRLVAEGLAGGWLDEQLQQHNVCVREIEVVSSWARASGIDDRNFEATAWEMADRWGCRYLQAIGPYEGSLRDVASRFGALCDRAADHGLVIGLEFLPFTNIINASTAWEIVQDADRDNGGVCVDIWHHKRGDNDLDQILQIPANRITSVQLSDGPMQRELDDYKDDCLRRRVPLEHGEFQVTEFVHALIAHGVDVPWSAEVCNDIVWDASPEIVHEYVQQVATSLRHVIDNPPRSA